MGGKVHVTMEAGEVKQLQLVEGIQKAQHQCLARFCKTEIR